MCARVGGRAGRTWLMAHEAAQPYQPCTGWGSVAGRPGGGFGKCGGPWGTWGGGERAAGSLVTSGVYWRPCVWPHPSAINNPASVGATAAAPPPAQHTYTGQFYYHNKTISLQNIIRFYDTVGEVCVGGCGPFICRMSLPAVRSARMHAYVRVCVVVCASICMHECMCTWYMCVCVTCLVPNVPACVCGVHVHVHVRRSAAHWCSPAWQHTQCCHTTRPRLLPAPASLTCCTWTRCTAVPPPPPPAIPCAALPPNPPCFHRAVPYVL